MIYEIGVTDRWGRRRVDARVDSADEAVVRDQAARYQARLARTAMERKEPTPTVDVRLAKAVTSSLRVGRPT